MEKTKEEYPWQKEENFKKSLVAMSRDDFDKMMVKKFPDIFVQRNKSMMETCMCWGFDVGPGWYALIYDLCVRLDFIGKKFGVVVVATQVKEKYGNLCFYNQPTYRSENFFARTKRAFVRILIKLSIVKEDFDILFKIIDDLVDYADNKSGHTCEECGEWGKKRTICGYISVLCDKHFNQRRIEMGIPIDEDPWI